MEERICISDLQAHKNFGKEDHSISEKHKFLFPSSAVKRFPTSTPINTRYVNDSGYYSGQCTTGQKIAKKRESIAKEGPLNKSLFLNLYEATDKLSYGDESAFDNYSELWTDKEATFNNLDYHPCLSPISSSSSCDYSEAFEDTKNSTAQSFKEISTTTESSFYSNYFWADSLDVEKPETKGVDFVSELQSRNCTVILTQLFSFLAPKDLHSVACVSQSWHSAITNDGSSNKKRKQYLNEKKELFNGSTKENREVQQHYRSPNMIRAGFREIQNFKNCVNALKFNTSSFQDRSIQHRKVEERIHQSEKKKMRPCNPCPELKSRGATMSENSSKSYSMCSYKSKKNLRRL